MGRKERKGRMTVNNNRLLDPKNDVVFRKLFGEEKNKEILLAFLNDIFAGVYPEIEEVTPLPTDHIPEVVTLAQSFVDVSCRDVEENRYIVEMQCYGDTAFLERACFYASRAYVNQKTEENSYRDLKSVRFLAILKKSIFPQEETYLTHNKTLSLKTYKCYMDQFSYSFLELDKINKPFEECENMVEKWAYFFKHAPEVIAETLAKISQECPVIGKAFDALDRFNYSPEEQERYDVRDMNADAIATSISDAKAEGLAEGEAKGEAKKAREMVMKMHRKGMDRHDIAEISQLSLDEVEEILAQAEESAKA
jgi:predicted transposase/invertase (TIGR01784 family)